MPLILGTNSIKDTGYNVANSLRFNNPSTDYLNRTPSSNGNRRTWTFSFWIKRTTTGLVQYILSSNDASGNYSTFRFNGDQIEYYDYFSSAVQYSLKTTRLFTDTSAFYHILLAYDTTQGTASNRIKLYINGVQETSFATSSYPTQNYDSFFNSTSYVNYLGTEGGGNNADGYMSEVCFIDGTALDPTSFGEFDEDSPKIFKPKDVSGLTFGTNGFYLDFEDSSALGNDVSGNNNDLTVNNLTAIDQTTDTCTNNFATLNPLLKLSNVTFSNGNTTVSHTSTGHQSIFSTIGFDTGKWYFEAKLESKGNYPAIGLGSDTDLPSVFLGETADSISYFYQGVIYKNNADAGGTFASYTAGDIIGVALDMDNYKVYFSKNGTFQNSGDPTSGSTGTGAISVTTGVKLFAVDVYGATTTWSANFGNPSFAISSGNSDGNGFGNFEYSVPSGYFSLCSSNLAEFG
tara:strand:- start:401 stop:1780 length:1380 start_codon:yes stop_codon:yes gene_type:complete